MTIYSNNKTHDISEDSLTSYNGNGDVYREKLPPETFVLPLVYESIGANAGGKKPFTQYAYCKNPIEKALRQHQKNAKDLKHIRSSCSIESSSIAELAHSSLHKPYSS